MPVYIVNYRYATDKAKIRSAQILIEGKDPKDARARAIVQLRSEHDRFQVGTLQAFTTSQ